MRHTYFEVKNFKGIAAARLDLSAKPRNQVYTLVGLNESGKTTVLEAIDHLGHRTDLNPLGLSGYSSADPHDLIPIAKRANFNDVVSVEAGFELDDADEAAIAEYALKTLRMPLTRSIRAFSIRQNYEFRNSRLLDGQPEVIWEIDLYGKSPRTKQEKELQGDKWELLTSHIENLLPTVHYFPNFLFDFPDRIYLDAAPSEPDKHQFFKQLMQDVLDAIGSGANLNDHVLARAQSAQPFDKKSLESVLLAMGANITSTVFRHWNKIFNKAITDKEIVVGIDQDAEGRWFLTLRLRDAQELYSVSERSLGFRWFFTFLLLTQYRGFRQDASKSVLFLFDEPASNLHPAAQSQLLESFGKFPRGATIIYTTHSHHMVNPDWLEGAWVVKNEAMSYDPAVEDFHARKSVVTLHRYREFAANHPNQATYFQPVLDVLDYRPGRLENVPAVVMLEGKNDYYMLRLFQRVLRETELYLLPGNGAGSLTEVLRLYLAWGRRFVAIVDGDKEGIAQRKRYEDLFGSVVDRRIKTVTELSGDRAVKGMERMLTEQERVMVQQYAYPARKGYKKVLFNRAIQELSLVEQPLAFSGETKARFSRVFSALKADLARE
jgi:energy-coupling factor transporter ATP-binding protein EcfA2